MGSSDLPPPHVNAPPWLIPVQTLLLAVGVGCWDVTYILMYYRARQTKSYSMPLIGLAINISWEIVYAIFAADTWLEKSGFATWLALDTLVVYSVVKYAPNDWKGTSQWVGRNVAWILAAMTVVGCVGHYVFMVWFFGDEVVMGVNGVSSMDMISETGKKRGKFWTKDGVVVVGYDTTELAFWSANFAGGVTSAASLAMLVARGHSGGTGYLIWFVRFVGSVFGMQLAPGLLWWYWPEANGFFISSLAVFMSGFTLLCDLLYPVALWFSRKTEVELFDGRLVAGESDEAMKQKKL